MVFRDPARAARIAPRREDLPEGYLCLSCVWPVQHAGDERDGRGDWALLSSLLSPFSKSTPERKHFSPGERNVAHPNTAPRNNLLPEWFPQQLKIWPNTFFFKWNLLQFHYSRHGFECKQQCWAITWQPGRKRAENKSETEIMVADLKSNEKEHQAAGRGQKRHRVSTLSIFLPASPGASCLQSVMSVVCQEWRKNTCVCPQKVLCSDQVQLWQTKILLITAGVGARPLVH